MSTERHHSRKRPNITIDAEAQNETVVEAADVSDATADPSSEASVDENVDNSFAAQTVEPAKVETAQARRGTGA